MADVQNADLGDVEKIGEAKNKLQNAVLDAKKNGVSEDYLKSADKYSKKLHNMIEDLKGSIRVFCRVRPLSSKEKDQHDTGIINQEDSMTVQIYQGMDKNYDFGFDAVFSPGMQEEVFTDCSDLL